MFGNKNEIQFLFLYLYGIVSIEFSCAMIETCCFTEILAPQVNNFIPQIPVCSSRDFLLYSFQVSAD